MLEAETARQGEQTMRIKSYSAELHSCQKICRHF